ncbi:MAG: sugar lactone lactonase YvrE [Verrucomicrobiales bacterium]|jgi:sugar lactone lactonase YvrE
MRTSSHTQLGAGILSLFVAVAACVAFCPAISMAGADNVKAKLELVHELSHGPAGMTVTPGGDIILSLHQYYRPVHRVVKIQAGTAKAIPFPNDPISRGAEGEEIRLDAVQGIQCDKKSVVWMLDNGRRSEVAPRIVAWNDKKNALHKFIQLPEECLRADSFVNDLVLNPEDPTTLYITDPAGGDNAAIIVVNVETGSARRVLEGDISVRPGTSDLIMDNRVVEAEGIDGNPVRPQFGVNGITLDRKAKWLYFGPLNGDFLHRIETKFLNGEKFIPSAEIADQVEVYCRKPPCDGISIDRDDNIYFTDLASKAIGVVDSKYRKYRLLVSDPLFDWPDGLCYSDKRFYFYTNQVHRSALFNNGIDRTMSGFYLFEFKGLESGITGN